MFYSGSLIYQIASKYSIVTMRFSIIRLTVIVPTGVKINSEYSDLQNYKTYNTTVN